MDTENTPQDIEAAPKKPGLLESKNFTVMLVSLTIIAALFLSFRIGMFVGFRQATTSYEYGASYHRVFGGPQASFMVSMPMTNARFQIPVPPPMDDFMGQDYMSAHGIFGQVLENDGNVLIINSKNGERTVMVSRDTAIRRGNTQIMPDDIGPNSQAVIIGSTDEQGQIQAKLIRIFP
ncbi:MAG: hypothetical protein WCW31_01680 [Patescibacteria group bacterium]